MQEVQGAIHECRCAGKGLDKTHRIKIQTDKTYTEMSPIVRSPLGKKLFPVRRMSKKTASREVGIFFFLLISFFYKLECTGGRVNKKKIFFFKYEKKVPVGHFRPTRAVHRKQLFI